MIPYPLFLICVPIGLYYISRSLRSRFGKSSSPGTPSPAVASGRMDLNRTTDTHEVAVEDQAIGLGMATIAANSTYPVRHLVETSLSNTSNSPIPNPDELVGEGEGELGTEQQILEPTNFEVYVQLQDELREDLIDLLEDQNIETDQVNEPDQIQSANESQYSASAEFESDEMIESAGSQVDQDHQVTQGQAERVKAQLRHLIEMVESEGQYQQNGQASPPSSSSGPSGQMGQSNQVIPPVPSCDHQDQQVIPPVPSCDHQDQHDVDEQRDIPAVQPLGEQDDTKGCDTKELEQDHVHKPAVQRGLGAEQVAALEHEVNVREDLDQAKSEEAIKLVGPDGEQKLKNQSEFQLGHPAQPEGQVEVVLTHEVVMAMDDETELANANQIVMSMDDETELANSNQVVTDTNQVVPEPVNTNQVVTQGLTTETSTGHTNQYELGDQKLTPENNRKALSAADSSVVDYQNVLPMRKAQYVTEEPLLSSELSFQLPIGHRPPSITRIENHTLSPGMASNSGVMWTAHTSPPPPFPPPPPRDHGEPVYVWNGPVEGLASPQPPQPNQCLVPEPQAADNNNAYYQSYYTLFVPTPYYTYAVIPK